jgi:hypothetical protein
VAIVKEHDGQVKTPQNRNREQDDGAHNEMNGEDAIKIYNELVKSPEDRIALDLQRLVLVQQLGHVQGGWAPPVTA